MPIIGPYGASKWALEAIAEGWPSRRPLRRQGEHGAARCGVLGRRRAGQGVSRRRTIRIPRCMRQLGVLRGEVHHPRGGGRHGGRHDRAARTSAARAGRCTRQAGPAGPQRGPGERTFPDSRDRLVVREFPIGQSHQLDNSVYSALTGPHAHFAQRRGNALRYPLDMSPFMALPDSPGDADWADIAALAGAGRGGHVDRSHGRSGGWLGGRYARRRATARRRRHRRRAGPGGRPRHPGGLPEMLLRPNAPSRDRSCHARSRWVPIWVFATAGVWWRWPVNDCCLPGLDGNQRSLHRRGLARTWTGYPADARCRGRASGSAARHRFSMRSRPTRTPSGCTNPWGSAFTAPQPLCSPGRRGKHRSGSPSAVDRWMPSP